MQVLGKLTGAKLEAAYEIAQSQLLDNKVKSSYAPKRLECWYGLASNLQSIPAGKAKIWECPQPHERLVRLGNFYLPGWHSLLACGGTASEGNSTTIDWHRDHAHFEGISLMLNLGDALFYEQPQRGSDKYDEHRLTDGMIIKFDTKLLHRAVQLSDTRFNFTFRKVKAEYLPANFR